MMTGKLIEQLADGLSVTRPLPPPVERAVRWLVVSLLFIVVIVTLASPREDLVVKIAQQSFMIEQLAALSTALLAAYAAFASTVPGSGRRINLLPILPLTVWLGALGKGCIDAWLQSGAAGLTLQPDYMCLPSIALVGSLPAIVIVVMLRAGAPLTPRITLAWGGLAAAGIGDFGLRFFHAQDASLMVLVWQVGSVLLLTALAAGVGRWLFNWHRATTAALGRSG